MVRFLRLARAFVCYWIMETIRIALAPWPRSPAKAQVVNFLARPFFSYGAYWAFRRNPNIPQDLKDKL